MTGDVWLYGFAVIGALVVVSFGSFALWMLLCDWHTARRARRQTPEVIRAAEQIKRGAL